MKFLADENLEQALFRGLLRQRPYLDIVRVQDIGLAGASDSYILAWAWDNQRILLTHDLRTMPRHVYERLAQGYQAAGVFVMRSDEPLQRLIQDILLIADTTTADEWHGQVFRLPL